jgi:hypothetical protein
MSDPVDAPNGENAGTPLSEPTLQPPIRLQGVNANGVVLAAAQKGEKVTVSFRAAMASDDPAFHQLAENFEGVIVHGLQKAGSPLVWINDAHNALLVVHSDDSADLWVNNVAKALIERESARRLAFLGGSEPSLKAPLRRRSR